MNSFHDTSSNNRAHNPGSYSVKAMMLYPHGIDEALSIYSIVADFQISESIYSPTIECIISVIDGVSLLDKFNILGDERVQIILAKKPLDDSSEEETFEIDLRIAEIINYTNNSPGQQFYQFHCVRPHMYINQSKLLQRPFSGTAAQIISKILKSDLDVQFGQVNISSKNTIRGIFPAIKPLEAIYWLLRNTYDDGTPYFIYDTFTKGMQLKSYKDMINQTTYETYNNSQFYQNKPGTEEYYGEKRRRILKISSDNYMGKLAETASGNFAATLHTIDISNKEYKRFSFAYNGKNKLNTNRPYSRDVKIRNRSYDQIFDNKNYYVSLNSSAFDNYSNYHEPNKTTIMESEATLHNMDFIVHNLNISGDLELCVGSKIEVVIVNSNEDREDRSDKLNSGLYIVTDIVNRFGKSHEQSIIIKKDSI